MPTPAWRRGGGCECHAISLHLKRLRAKGKLIQHTSPSWTTLDTVYLIPDTNLFLQCKALRELPWHTAFPSADKIVLVLIAPVLREIDGQKGGQGRVARRARNANSQFGGLLHANEVLLSQEGKNPLVQLISANEVRPDLSLSDALDYAQADGRIVGTAVAFKNSRIDSEVFVLSNDTGLLLSARQVGMPSFTVPDEWLLPAENDDENKRINQLESELKRIRSAEPNCVIELGNEKLNFVVERFAPLSELQVAKLMATIRARFPQATDFDSPEKSTRSSSIGFLAAHWLDEFVRATDEDISRYQQEQYPNWLMSCEKCLKDLHLILERSVKLPVITMNLRNDGSRPADQVRVRFYTRGGRLQLKSPETDEDRAMASFAGIKQIDGLSEFPIRLPDPPAPPRGYWRKMGLAGMHEQMAKLLNVSQSSLQIPSSLMRPPPKREPDHFYWASGSHHKRPSSLIELTCDQWRHRAQPEFFEFEMVSPSDMEPTIDAIHVEIHASNLADPVCKSFRVEIVPQEGDTWGEAQALVDILG